MIEIQYQPTLLKLLSTVAAESGNKTSLAGGQFKQDYGNVFYLTQNRTRANQLNGLLAQEMADSSEKTLIPPTILPYTAGFVRLAALAKFGYIDSLNVCRYSDEWFNLFLYEVAKRVVPEEMFKDEFGMTDNKRANLAKDFRVFIRDVVLHLKTAEAEKLYADLANTPETEQLFLEAYHAYREEEKKFSNTENQFMHPLQAYEDLYARVRKDIKTGINKVIIVENEDLLEPIFREILTKLDCPVYVLKDSPVSDDDYKQKTELYHFMTPLDEAEFVGWKIKSLLEKETPYTDIGVVCASPTGKEMLEAVFKRMNIAGDQLLPLAANGYYRLVKMLFSLIYNAEEVAFSAEALLADDKSKFKLGRGFYIFQKMLGQKGLQFQLAPKKALTQSIESFMQDEKIKDKYKNPSDYEQDVKALTRLKELLQAENPSVSQIAERALNDTKDKPLINDIMAALYELDENLKEAAIGSEEFIKKAHTLFGVLDRRELNTTRQPLALESKEDTSYDEPELNYSFSVVPLEMAKTLRAKHLFLCGFSAAADKIGLLCYPDALAKKLQLPTLGDKKKRGAQSVQYALNYAGETAVTYAYLTMESKENGQAALVQLLRQVLPTEKQHIGPDNCLLKSYELISEMPDPSWTGAQTVQRKETKLQTFAEETLFAQTRTCGDLLNEVLKKDENGRLIIAAKAFADFIVCPSKFFFAQLANYCGMETADTEGVKKMARGTFWHAVFEEAAKQPDFYTKDPAQIKTLLAGALSKTAEPKVINQFDPRDRDTFISESQADLALFARNEAERQTKYQVNGNAGLEEKFTHSFKNCPVVIHGKVDRKDTCADGSIFFWDYKTGNPKVELVKFCSEKGRKGNKHWELEKRENYLQLAIYMYAAAKTRPQDQTEPPKLRGGNIFINGKDNAGEQGYDLRLEELLDKQAEEFAAYFDKPLSELPKENEVSDSGPCKYCAFREACKVISKTVGGKL